MKSFQEICLLLRSGQFELTRHAFKRAVERNISDREICDIGVNGEIIEDYPDDKYAPSCLIFGVTADNRPLHVQVSRADTDMLKIITLYEPDPDEWIDGRTRR